MEQPTGNKIFSGRASVRTYREDGFQPIPNVFLEDQEYGRGLQRFVPACTDIVIVNSAERTIYLAKRKSKPLTGWWWMGGGMQANETPMSSAIRCFRRETGIDLTLKSKELILRNVSDYLWKDRQQEPQDIGCHTLGYTFSIELPIGTIEQIKLEPNEFDAKFGLTAFAREDLAREKVFPAVLDLYDDIFPLVT